jgi:hypothetical protein
MNEININEGRLDGSILLSTAGMDIALRKIGHISYGVTEKGYGLRFAFASAELTKYLARRKKRKIIDVKLLKQYPIVGYEEDETNILRLRFDDSKVALLDKYDHVYEFEPVILERGESILVSAHKQWALPANGVAGLMLLTRRMIHTIEDIADEGQHAYLINILWKEYRLAVETSRADEFERICVEGEFMSFSVKRFAHGLFVFDHV